MYKDKDRQRAANRRAQAKFKAKQGITQKVLPEQGITRHVSDQEFTMLLATVPPGTPNQRVSKPGDADYEPQCETTRAFIEGRPKNIPKPKPVNTFADLPPDVQATIRSLSHSNEEMKRRTAIALAYQQMFPDNTNRGIE